MALATKGIFIIGAKRTPFCKFGGPLRELPASHIFATAAKDAIDTAKLNPELIDNTVVGNLHFLSQCDGGKTPRHCGIYSGVPLDKPALGVNKSCGTGLQSVISGAVDILTGVAQISLTGGTDNMSALPFVVRNVRFGTTLGARYLYEDMAKLETVDSRTGLTMQAVAEGVAKKHGVGRADADGFAVRSHRNWTAAQELKVFEDELSPIKVTVKSKELLITKDELPDPTIDTEQLRNMAVFSDGTVVTAGNSAMPADGAAAIILASEDSVNRHQMSPLARVAGWASSGNLKDTVQRLLDISGIKLEDIDLFEINETFGPQVIALAKELDINMEKVNPNGGGIAMGNPVSAAGSRLIVHLVHQLRRKNLKRGITASSCGGDQAVAVLIET